MTEMNTPFSYRRKFKELQRRAPYGGRRHWYLRGPRIPTSRLRYPAKYTLREVTSKYLLAQVQGATCCKRMRRSRVHRASSGCGRTSLDSMTYSSESSPTAHAHARRSRTVEEAGPNRQITKDALCSMQAWLNDELDDSAGHAPEEGTSMQNQINSSQCAVRIATGETRQEHVLESETAALVSTKFMPGRSEKDNESSVVEQRRVCSLGCSEGHRPQRENAQKAANPLAQGRGLGNVARPSSVINGNIAGALGSGDYRGVFTVEEPTNSTSSATSLSLGVTALATPVDQRASVAPLHGIGPEGDAEARRQDHESMKESRNRKEAEMKLWLSQDSEEEESMCDEKKQAKVQLGREKTIK